MAADWNVRSLAPVMRRVNGRTWTEGAKLTQKREAVPSSRIRNEILQFAHLKPAQNPKSAPSRLRPERRAHPSRGGDIKKDTHDVLARWLEVIVEAGVILEDSDVL
jgi:hypothetical protein